MKFPLKEIWLRNFLLKLTLTQVSCDAKRATQSHWMSGQKSTKHTATETQTEQTPAHHYFSSAVKKFSDMSEESVHTSLILSNCGQ